MWTLIHAPGDAQLARRIDEDLRREGLELADAVLIAVLSREALADQSVQSAIRAELGRARIVPVLAEPVALPAMLSALMPLDFSATYNFRVLRAILLAQPAGKTANRRAVTVLATIAIIMFVIGLIAVGVFGLQRPEDEFDAVDTQAAATIQALLGENLPRTTQEAANFPLTLEAAPTAQRPLLIATTTAIARE